MQFLHNKTILITGACGMVGARMLELLEPIPCSIIATRYNPTVDIYSIQTKAHWVECDIRYSEIISQLIHEHQPDFIFHLAAQSYPAVSWERPQETFDINVNGTINLFEAIKRLKQKNKQYDPMVLVACSAAQYGAAITAQSIDEATSFLPLQPYGISKVAQDLLAFQYFVNNDIRTIRARIFNTTGVRKKNDVISDFVTRAVLFENNKIDKIAVGNLETKRAIMDVDDLIQAFFLLAEKGAPGEAYNICAQRAHQINDILFMIETELSKKLPYFVDPKLLRSSDEPIILGDCTKIIQLGWHQHIPIQETLQKMIQWQRKKFAQREN
jgi:GDP-4-dehydro-6-deoxy-D-mannose reductase